MQTLRERLNLESDEVVLRTVRKHWFILLREAIGPLILFFVPLAGYAFIKSRFLDIQTILPLPTNTEQVDALLLFFLSSWGLFVWMLLFYVWTDYYLDVWKVTDRRIIAIDQRGFFRRVVASFRFERLQDITAEVHGLIATFLNFGDLRAQTAGRETDFKIAGVPDPRGVKTHILEIVDHMFLRKRNAHAGAPGTRGMQEET